jgi:MoxR-like ATPase
MARTPGAEAVYEVADLFRQQSLAESRSILWPGEEIWTLENISEIERLAFFPSQEGGVEGHRYWDDIARTLRLPIRKLGAEIALMYQLFPSKGAQSKLGDIRYMLEGDPPLVPNEDAWRLVEEAANHGLGGAGRWYSSGGQQWSAWYYVSFARGVKVSSANVNDRDRMQAIADEVEREIRYNTLSARNMVLHLLFPESYEPISNHQHKEKIRSSFSSHLNVPVTSDIDHDLRSVRDVLLQTGYPETFGFYEPDIRRMWDGKDTIYSPPATHDDTVTLDDKEDLREKKPSALSELLAATHLPVSLLSDINDLLENKKQLIFEGPPGSGKTYVAEKFARWFTDQSLDVNTLPNEQVEIVQFHQSYGYEDFVQGIRPETNDEDQLVYRIRDGIFLTLCERAKANPEKPFVLIIDEINRGNISRIFGELLLLLEYRGMSVRLPYGSGDQATLTIPKNLYIIGTMNTADRSLAQIDYALRRRFYFMRFMPVADGRAEVFGNWLENQDMEQSDRSRLLHLFVTLNRGIREHLSTDDLQIGHSYFMTDGIETEAVMNRVWRRAVLPLLNEYLHHHRDRDDILAKLAPASLVRTTVEVVPENDSVLDEQADGSGPDPV